MLVQYDERVLGPNEGNLILKYKRNTFKYSTAKYFQDVY